jgi:uncharacterized protein with HEPN domain
VALKKHSPEKRCAITNAHGCCARRSSAAFEVISEASRHLGRDLKAQYKDVRWQDIAGIGNILRHDYQRVDASIIWRAVKDDLPPLKEALLALQASLK